jgi:hypothetical protein
MKPGLDTSALIRYTLVSSPGWAILALWIASGTPVPAVRLEIGDATRRYELPVAQQYEQVQPPTSATWEMPK